MNPTPLPLNDILDGVVLLEVQGSLNRLISMISFDSRIIEDGYVYVAVPGTQVDGHRFIENAIAKGATVIVCETLPAILDGKTTYLKVQSSSKALGVMASRFFGNPSGSMRVVGITGTNGKTTVATLLHAIFRKLGYTVGLLSTIKNAINEQIIPSTHTTADAVQINSLMSKMVEEGCQLCFMEITSHSIDQNRIAGLNFAGGIFTNISHDHLDYHKTFEAYFQTKKRFFDSLNESAFALTNADDERGLEIVQDTAALKKTYALESAADFQGSIVESSMSGLKLEINQRQFTSKLMGRFNAYNFIAAFAATTLLAEVVPQINEVMAEIKPIDGRFDVLTITQGVSGIVDFAHTPDGLKKILADLREVIGHQGRLIVVIGCGGDRDKEKRPIMGKIAYENSDIAIFTSDNPRTEKPEEIIEEMLFLLPERGDESKLKVILDRKEAIREACLMAKNEDTILVAGRGHEEFQQVGNEKIPFKDKKILQDFLSARESLS